MTLRITILMLMMAIAGCSTTRTKEDIARDQANAEAARDLAAQKKAAARQEKMEAEIAQVPKWVMDPPKADAQGLYAVGMATSEDLRISMRKATLDAEFGLAKLYRQELSGSERAFDQERNSKGLSTQYTAVVDKLVARVPVIGYETVEQQTKPVNGSYQTWILLKLPYAQFNKVLQEQKAESIDQTVKEAFDDLERRVRARQADRLSEEQARQAMRLTELGAKNDAVAAATKPADNKPKAGD